MKGTIISIGLDEVHTEAFDACTAKSLETFRP